MDLKKELVSEEQSYMFIVLQSIKDVNQSLWDDNLVETDKIGAGSFFWSLPSKGFNLVSKICNY